MHAIVITGASTGIGFATAKVLLAHGFRVFGSVRKQADAERLARELGASFTALRFDVTDEAAVAAGAALVRAALGGERLAGLVNNAGVAVPGPLLELTVDEFRRQIEINLTGQLIVTRAFAPLLGLDGSLKGAPGRIVMVSSVAGRRALPFLGPYSASKHALEGLSEALRCELMTFGIDVIIIGPGTIRTPIWDKAEAVDLARYESSPYREALRRLRDLTLANARSGLEPEAVGRLILRALTAPRPWVRYAIVPDPLLQAVTALLPRRLLDRIIARRLGLTAKQPAAPGSTPAGDVLPS